MKLWYFIIDVEKCENCKNCFLACKDEYVSNDWPGYSAPMPDHGPSWITTEGKERGNFPFVDVAYLPAPCMHCDDAPCIKAAKGAIYKRKDGIVIIDPAKAKGQKNIIDSCPYRAITWNEEKQIPQKCTMCAHLLDSGWKKTRCVQSCPTGALSLRNVEESEMKKIAVAEGLEAYRPNLNTNPRVLYRNLYQYTRRFIGGSVTVKIDGKDECAEGVKVTLIKGDGKIAECLTDNYGDFKIDNLEENCCKYKVQLSFTGHGMKTFDVDLKESVYLGVINM